MNIKDIRNYKIYSSAINNFLVQKNFPKVIHLKQDIFERQTKIKKFVLNHFEYKSNHLSKVKVIQNPDNKAIIYQKIFTPKTGTIQKIPVEADIAESQYKWLTTYHFLEPKTNEEIGFVTICDWRKAKRDELAQFIIDGRLLDDFPRLGLTGERVSIEFLQNNMHDKYAGIGEAADQLGIEYCLRNGIKPNITSLADQNSHAAHYKRGKRFLPLDKNDPDTDYYEFKAQFGTTDPNKIVAERIKSTPRGQEVECSDLGNLYMYLPQEVVKMYLEKIKKCPFLQ